MPGSIRALRRQADPVRGGGRIPLVKKRTAGRPQFRTAGADTLSAQEEAIADSVEAAFGRIPQQTLLDSLERRDEAGYALAVLNALSDAQGRLEEALLASFVSSGETSAIDLGRELSRQYRQVGKAETPSPSEVALRFRFNTTDPRATAWAQNEAGRLITNMAASEREMFRALVEQSFVESRTVGTTASSIFQQLQTVTPTPTARDFGQSIGANLNGLTERYERAVMNRVASVADDLAARGITGTKALERMRKEGDKYATKLRRARSKTIARTERMMAHNQARLLSYQQAIDTGLMSRDHSRKVWATGPFDVCPICVGMAGVEAKVADPFTLPNGTQVQAPPAHPNCRCTLQTRTDTTLYEPPTLLGSNQPGDPFRFGGRGFTSQGQQFAGRPLPGTAPVAAPVDEPEIIELPPPPAPAPQVTPVRGPALRDDLDAIKSQGGVGDVPVGRPPSAVNEIFDGEFAERSRQLGPRPPASESDALRKWKQDQLFLSEEFRETPAVVRWEQEMVESIGDSLAVREAEFKVRQHARDYFDMRVSYLDGQRGLSRAEIVDMAERLSDPRNPYHQGRVVTEYEVREAIERTGSRFTEWLDEADINIQIESDILESVLDSGRVMNQFESGRSAFLDVDGHKYKEWSQFGIPYDASPRVRPVYGHIQKGNRTGADEYGAVRIVLKPSAKERTTYTMADSHRNIDMAFPATRPNADLVRVDPDKWPVDYGLQYVEAQIHGGVPVDDIAEVVFDTGNSLYKDPSASALQKLEDAGIPYRFVEREGAWKRDTYRTIANPVT